ncbi:MAG: HAD family hydrolase [Aggregatilineales bacterium]
MSIAAIIFDMDGVLVDSEKFWQRARVDFAATFGKSWSLADQRQLMGSSTREWVKYMQQRLELDMPDQAVEEAIKTRLLGYYEQELPILPGAVEAVKLAASHYPVGLASGSSHWAINAIMRITGLGPLFGALVSADEVARGKPAPDVFLETARRLGALPDQTIGIEDSANGIRALKAGGMKAIAVPTPEIPLSLDVLAMADITLASLTQFDWALLQKLS